MAVHQYIGARYVPYYYENSLDPTSTEWEPNVNYEALTIVTLPNLHSYISKKFVPDSIGSPALNAEYWLDTGSENAYIAQLQQDLGDVATLQTTDKSSAVNAINEVLTELEKKTTRKTVVFGNSFAEGVNGVTGIYFLIEDLFDDSVKYVVGGASFLTYTNNGNNTFANLLSGADDDDEVTDVLILGAVGDTRSQQEYSTSAWITAMQNAAENFVTAAKLKYPNVKTFKYINCSAAPHMHNSSSRTASGYTDYQAEFWGHLLYDECFKTSDIVYCGWAGWDIMLEPSYFQADNVHPTQDGTDIIAKNCRTILEGGELEYMEKTRTYNVTLISDPDGHTANSTIVNKIYPDRTLQTQQGTSNASGAYTFPASTTTWLLYDPNADTDVYMPPIGYYNATGGVFSSQYKQMYTIAQIQRAGDTSVNESLLYDPSKGRTPIWNRASITPAKIYAERLRRLPAKIEISHNPLDTSQYL